MEEGLGLPVILPVMLPVMLPLATVGGAEGLLGLAMGLEKVAQHESLAAIIVF